MRRFLSAIAILLTTFSFSNAFAQDIPAPADVSAPPADAAVTPSGLATKVLQKGTGTAHPSATSQVKVHYTGWTTDGKMFDSSVARGEPITFGLDQVTRDCF